MKSLWKLPEPWTPRTRPPLLGKPKTVFHELPQASPGVSFKGDISIEGRMGTFLTRLL